MGYLSGKELGISIPVFAPRSSPSGVVWHPYCWPDAAERRRAGAAGSAGSEEQCLCIESLSGGSRVGENALFEQFEGISKLSL